MIFNLVLEISAERKFWKKEQEKAEKYQELKVQLKEIWKESPKWSQW